MHWDLRLVVVMRQAVDSILAKALPIATIGCCDRVKRILNAVS
jgi:hypothetical protein